MAKIAAKTEKKTQKRKNTRRKASPKEQATAETSTPEQSGSAASANDKAADTNTKTDAQQSKRAREESTHAKYERVKKGNLYLVDLQKLTVQELHDIAKKENIKEYTALKKQDLIFRILKERIRQDGLLYGEGVLEVLPDGYGFLRNPRYNYLSSPDDIYVSPSQIRRFGLRTGNVISGQIRPPKDSEKYFALLRVEAIN